jgi:hypothetical protein
MYIHVGTAWRLKGHNPGLKGFRCVQLHNVFIYIIIYGVTIIFLIFPARLMMMYKIDRELVFITKENRLIPPCRRSRNTHNRAFQLESRRDHIWYQEHTHTTKSYRSTLRLSNSWQQHVRMEKLAENDLTYFYLRHVASSNTNFALLFYF